jgi:imidazolonepropionase
MRETQVPPVAALRAAGVPIALATDCNPGTSPLTSPLLVLNMAATLFRMTVEEALRGMTANAARALGLHDSIGTLEPGKACDLAIWSIREPAELVYRIGFNTLYTSIKDGR